MKIFEMAKFHLSKSTTIEIVVASIVLIFSYLAASFIKLDIVWIVNVTALFRAVFLFIWMAASLLIIYFIEK